MKSWSLSDCMQSSFLVANTFIIDLNNLYTLARGNILEKLWLRKLFLNCLNCDVINNELLYTSMEVRNIINTDHTNIIYLIRYI